MADNCRSGHQGFHAGGQLGHALFKDAQLRFAAGKLRGTGVQAVNAGIVGVVAVQQGLFALCQLRFAVGDGHRGVGKLLLAVLILLELRLAVLHLADDAQRIDAGGLGNIVDGRDQRQLRLTFIICVGIVGDLLLARGISLLARGELLLARCIAGFARGEVGRALGKLLLARGIAGEAGGIGADAGEIGLLVFLELIDAVDRGINRGKAIFLFLRLVVLDLHAVVETAHPGIHREQAGRDQQETAHDKKRVTLFFHFHPPKHQ